MIRFKGVTSFTKHTLLGEPFTVYRELPLVPRIDDRCLDCSIFLYPFSDAAEKGERIGGSGFLMAVAATGREWLLDGCCPQPDFHHCYAVSARHVVTKNPVIRLNTHDGRFDVVPLGVDNWTLSDEHDLAIVPIEYNTAYKYLFVSLSMFLTKDIAKQRDIGIGDEVFMVGRFISHDGKQRNSPTVRWGHIAMMPSEPVFHHSNKTSQQEGFLVEIHSISGYSGSPVFVRPFSTEKMLIDNPLNTTVYSATANNAVYSSSGVFPPKQLVWGGPWLLGVEWGYINSHDQWENNSGVSGVVPSWFIRDLLDTDAFREQRADEQRKLVERFQRGGTTLT